MGKHKYLFWSFIGIWLVVIAAGGVWAWHVKTVKDKRAVLDTSTASVQSSEPAAQTGTSNQSQVLQSNNTSATTSNQGSPQVAGASTGTTDASKLLDPTTFAQYDKYKDSTTAMYIDLLAGTGATLSSGHEAAVYYKGWLTNGQLFDESRAGSDGKLQTFAFTLGEHKVISGWEEALDGMKAGGVRLLIIPPSTGYGANGQGSIPPNAVLVFQVQLVSVQ